MFDNASNIVNRGIASAGRGTKSLSLKAQIGDLGKRREELTAKLGASLFEETRNDSRLRLPRESMYAAIEGLDKQLAALQRELSLIERQAHASEVSSPVMACSACGNPVALTDAFCANCGANVAEAKKDMRLCAQCGSLLSAEDLFCMVCGAPAASAADDAPAVSAAPATGEAAPATGDVPVVSATPCASEPPARQEAFGHQSVSATPQPEPPLQGFCSQDEPVSSMPFPASSEGPFDADKTMPIEDLLRTPIGAKAGLCPQCGFENVADARFCRNCGQAL